MKIHGINKHLYMMPEGDDSGGGGAPPAPPAPPEEQMISKAEADKQAAQQRRKHDRQMKEMQKKMEEQQAELEKLKSKPAPPTPPNGNPNPTGDPAVDGKLEIMEAKFSRQIEDLQGQVQSANEAAEAERQKRLQLERQQLIDKALAEAGVVTKHLVQARRFFDPQIEWDQLEERWMFRTQSGNIVEIAEGVAAEMPDNLKSTKMKGGAGTTAGMPAKKKAQHDALQAAKKRMTEIQAEMKKAGPKNHLLAQFSRAKNEVARLEKELADRN